MLVTGATGRQGGATARELLARGWRVRALVRDPSSSAAKALQGAGAELAQGDLEDKESLTRAVDGVYGVFSLQNYWGKDIGYEGEVRQGGNLAEAAAGAGIKHFVQASIASCDEAPTVRHFTSKHVIEKQIDALGLPRTFLRVVFFLDNFADPKVGWLMLPVLAGALKPDVKFHMVAVDDIGWFAAEAFTRPDVYLGHSVDIAGDALTVAEMKAVYERATGKRAPRWSMPLWAFRLINREMAEQFTWNNEVGWHFDVESVRSMRPTMLDLEGFLRRAAQMKERGLQIPPSTGLEKAYAEASSEVDLLWESAVGDGLASENGDTFR